MIKTRSGLCPVLDSLGSHALFYFTSFSKVSVDTAFSTHQIVASGSLLTYCLIGTLVFFDVKTAASSNLARFLFVLSWETASFWPTAASKLQCKNAFGPNNLVHTDASISECVHCTGKHFSGSIFQRIVSIRISLQTSGSISPSVFAIFSICIKTLCCKMCEQADSQQYHCRKSCEYFFTIDKKLLHYTRFSLLPLMVTNRFWYFIADTCGNNSSSLTKGCCRTRNFSSCMRAWLMEWLETREL